jgi:hypothetical protein
MPFIERKVNLTKQPFEKFLIAIGFENDLASGETIASAVVTDLDLATESAPAATILDGSPLIGTVSADGKTFTVDATGTDVGHVIKVGNDGERYKVTFRITTSQPYQYEADVIINVSQL